MFWERGSESRFGSALEQAALVLFLKSDNKGNGLIVTRLVLELVQKTSLMNKASSKREIQSQCAHPILISCFGSVFLGTRF